MAEWAFDILQFALLGWFAVMAAVIALKILRGDMPLAGMLASVEHGRFDPERVQSLAVFMFVIGAYAVEVLAVYHGSAPLNLNDGRPTMPDIPESLLVLLTGSNGVYLAGKIARKM